MILILKSFWSLILLILIFQIFKITTHVLCCCPTYLLQYISNAVISPAYGIAVDLLHTNY